MPLRRLSLRLSLATVVLFVTIYSSMNPVFLGFPTPAQQELVSGPVRSQLLFVTVLKKMGLMPPEDRRVPVSRSDPKISGLYFLPLGDETTLGPDHDDFMSVITMVDSTGSSMVQDVLEYPRDPVLLSQYIDMIKSARWRPASQNGRAVDSRLVLTFTRIYVYD